MSCPDGTLRVERVFRSADPGARITGLSESCERPDGLLHGPIADWHRVGPDASARLVRVYQGQYEEGREFGTWHQWYVTGDKKADRYYLQGGELVAHVNWYPGARLRAIYHYWRYRRHGVEIYWEESGEISTVRILDRGRVVHTSEIPVPDHSNGHGHGHHEP